MDYREQRAALQRKIQKVSKEDFDSLALEVFRFQSFFNPVYGRFLELLRILPESVQTVRQIPFLPVSVFKQHLVQTGVWEPAVIFTSSTSGGGLPGRHATAYPDDYLFNTRRCFSTFYESPQHWTFLALLPSYLEREGSSLIAMAQHFIKISNKKESGFFLNNITELAAILKKLEKDSRPTILLGVSFALLDFAEAFPMILKNTIIMETGGMKGRRAEMTRPELHQILKKAFKQKKIHSEYGMTELFSQAYSQGDGIFNCPPTLKIFTREVADPLILRPSGKSGAVNIIDLANLDTCAFIAADDLGKVYENGSFEIIGRADNSEMRGCNLMVE